MELLFVRQMGGEPPITHNKSTHPRGFFIDFFVDYWLAPLHSALLPFSFPFINWFHQLIQSKEEKEWSWAGKDRLIELLVFSLGWLPGSALNPPQMKSKQLNHPSHCPPRFIVHSIIAHLIHNYSILNTLGQPSSFISINSQSHFSFSKRNEMELKKWIERLGKTNSTSPNPKIFQFFVFCLVFVYFPILL